MAEVQTRSRAGRLVTLGGRLAISALAVVAIAVGGGMTIGLSPILIGVLAGTVILLAVAGRPGSLEPAGDR